MTGPRQGRPTTGLDGATVSRDLAAYFAGLLAGRDGGPGDVPDRLSAAGMACWLDGYIEGSSDTDVDDRSVCCLVCRGVGCRVCLPGVAA